ncbi:Mss4-like protein [Gloeopeniophorella convolvens]|nr:Mss4-like protein [Gloeopeniophorella convolvens]
MSQSTISPSSPLTGSCFCGAVTYALTAPPVLRAYCHCSQCQRLTGCPFVHTVHFPASAFTWTHDAPVDTFVNPNRPWKTRTRCRTCGATVASRNSKTDRVSAWGAHFPRDESGRILRWDQVCPTAHIFYETRMLDIPDSLSKWTGYEGSSERIA